MTTDVGKIKALDLFRKYRCKAVFHLIRKKLCNIKIEHPTLSYAGKIRKCVLSWKPLGCSDISMLVKWRYALSVKIRPMFDGVSTALFDNIKRRLHPPQGETQLHILNYHNCIISLALDLFVYNHTNGIGRALFFRILSDFPCSTTVFPTIVYQNRKVLNGQLRAHSVCSLSQSINSVSCEEKLV